MLNKFKDMDLEEVISYCYDKEDEFIQSGGSRDEFDSLILLLQDGDISPSDLIDYGIE